MNKLRELFSDTLIYGISNVVARFINYILVPFHTDVFSPARYGVVNLVYVSIAFLNVVFTFGMESAYLRYAEDRKNAPHIFKSLQLTLFSFASILVLLLWFSMPALTPLMNLDADTTPIYLMMLGILWFDTLSIVPFAELRLVRRSYLFATLKVIHVIINIALNFYLILALGFNIEAVFLANLIATIIVTLLVNLFTRDLFAGRVNVSWIKKSVTFGWPFVPAGIGFVINEMLDRHFLNNMNPDDVFRLYGSGFTPEDIVGIYSACYKLAVFMLLLVQMYRMAWQPFFMRHSNKDDTNHTFGQAFIWFNAFAALVFIVVSTFREQIVGIELPLLNTTLIDSRYWMGLDIVPWLLLAYWFHGWYINFSSGIFIKEKTSVLYKITMMGAAITIVMNLLLVPLYGMTGSAIATLASYLCMSVTLGLYSKRVMNVPYRLPAAFGLMAISAIIVFSEPVLAQWFGIPTTGIRTIMIGFGAVITGLYLWLLTAPEDKFQNRGGTNG